MGKGRPGKMTTFTGLPDFAQARVLEIAQVVSPRAKCIRELFQAMAWDAAQEEVEDDEGFVFNFCDWRRNPFDYLGCHLTRFTIPPCPFVSGNSRRQWRAEDM